MCLISDENTSKDGTPVITRQGRRYILAYGPDFYGIWEGDLTGQAVSTFPRSDEGWREAGLLFNSLESAPKPEDEKRRVRDLKPPRRSWLLAQVLFVTAVLGGLAFVALLPFREKTPPPTDLLYRTDFSDPAGGLPLYPFPEGRAEYVAGSYRMRFHDPVGFIVPMFPFKGPVGAISVDVDVTLLSSPAESHVYAGIGCMFGDDDGFALLVGPHEGEPVNVRVLRIRELQSVEIGGFWSESLRRDGVNHLRAECRGYRDGFVELTLFVNGRAVPIADDRIEVTELGFVGFALDATTEKGDVEISFDELFVRDLRFPTPGE